MISISLDTKPVSDALGAMIRRIDHFKRVDIGQGLSDFQTDDMHRGRPFTMRSRAKGTATTKIRPHSLYEVKRAGKTRRRVVRRFAKTTGVSPAVARQYLQYSSRPILRSKMYEVLEAATLDGGRCLDTALSGDSKRVCAGDHDHADRIQSWRAGIRDARHL